MSISFFETVISDRAIQQATEVLRSGWVSEGFRVAEFEEVLSREHLLSHPVALNSGTSALHLALVLAGVKAGDEVVLPPQTFVATGHAVLMQQATPVFADIDPTTGNLSAASLECALSARTRAVIAVHWGGYPCDLTALGEIAARHNVVLIEDAAHAFGAALRGRAIGSLSRFTCFSFQAIKHVTCGDGGALCCSDAADAAEARRRRWFGIDRAQAGPFELGEREGDIGSAGFKYHMNDLAAAIGLGNLAGFRERLARRREIAAVYREGLEGVPGLTLLRADPATIARTGCSRCWWSGGHRSSRRSKTAGFPPRWCIAGSIAIPSLAESGRRSPVRITSTNSRSRCRCTRACRTERSSRFWRAVRAGW